MPILETQNLTYVYGEGTPFRITAVEDVNISVEKGEFVGIIGHTGSGKSTLVQHLNGLLKPTAGKILLNGEDIHSSKEVTRAARFKVGLCFQYPEYQLFESTVYRDIAFGPKNMGLSEAQVKAAVTKAAEFVGIHKDWMEKSPFDLSGGEKRRVAIAGVMAMEPEILILDEPTAGLDPRGRARLSDMIENYRKSTGNTVIIVSHSMDDVARLADRLVVFNRGEIRFDGTPEEVFSNPEELKDIGLNVPAATELAMELRRIGVSVPASIYTNEQLLAALLELRKGAQQC